jgi:phosphoribosylformimino-5-aminoimidazole carboxamide ribotide isomerase
MQNIGVKTIICTDISRDGAMRGTNLELYKKLNDTLDLNIVASGGVTDMSDIENLAKIGVYGAIIGKAYYTGAINLNEAVEKAK